MLQTSRMARQLSHQWKLTVRTIEEIDGSVEELQRACHAAGVKFQGRKLGNEGTLNAMVLAFLDRPLDDQVELIGRYVARFETMLESDTPVEMTPPDKGIAVIDENTAERKSPVKASRNKKRADRPR
jgi:hypothetical protein